MAWPCHSFISLIRCRAQLLHVPCRLLRRFGPGENRLIARPHGIPDGPELGERPAWGVRGRSAEREFRRISFCWTNSLCWTSRWVGIVYSSSVDSQLVLRQTSGSGSARSPRAVLSSETFTLMENPFGETMDPHQRPVEVICGRGATPKSIPAFRYPAHDQSPLMIIPALPIFEQHVRDVVVGFVGDDPVHVPQRLHEVQAVDRAAVVERGSAGARP